MTNKTIITAAITGAIHVPSMSPYLPITPQQIIDDAVYAAEAGAAVVHIHARNPQTGAPSVDMHVMREIVSGIKKRSDVVICITTGAGLGMSLEERLRAVPSMQPEIASCNAGSFNFVISGIADKLKEPKFDWEIPYLKNTDDFVFANTYRGLKYYVKTMNEYATLPEFEVYDVAMINNLAYFKQQGIITQPIYIQYVLGIQGGLPASVDHLVYLRQVTRDLLGTEGVVWSCAGAGRSQLPMAAATLALGGNVRVGLEDNLYLKSGVLAKSSAEQVLQVRTLIETMNKAVATPSDARKILQLKGLDKVSF